MAAPKAIAASKNIIQQQQQNIKQFTSEALKYTQEKTCAEISCSFIKKEAPALEFFFEIIKNSFIIRSFIEHLRTTAAGRAQNFTENGPNSNS